MGAAVRLGFQSRSSVIRSLGYDPEKVMAEIAADNAVSDDLGLSFDSDARKMTEDTGAPQEDDEDESKTFGG